MGKRVMSKRVGLTLPDTIHERLETWAKAEGRPLANLCNFLLEKAVRDAIAAGQFPEVPEQGKDSHP